jgi:glycerophosphoryl diester phosphodiesterase
MYIYIYIFRGFVDRAHAAGKRVLFWTFNSPSEMAACLATGADGFFTDEVAMARAALVTAGLLPQP